VSASVHAAQPTTAPTLRPGDRLSCADCGAVAVAYSTSGRWSEGHALALDWSNGVMEATHFPSPRCPTCHSRAMSLGRPDLPPQIPTRGAPAALALPTAAAPRGQLALL
jgi:hypothetical protein